MSTEKSLSLSKNTKLAAVTPLVFDRICPFPSNNNSTTTNNNNDNNSNDNNSNKHHYDYSNNTNNNNDKSLSAGQHPAVRSRRTQPGEHAAGLGNMLLLCYVVC